MLKVQEIKEIIRALDQSSINEFKYEVNGSKISMKKQDILTTNQSAVPQLVTQVVPDRKTVEQSAVKTEVKEKVVKENERPKETQISFEDNLQKITAPMVGTFYAAPAPDAEAYVKVGDKITEDSVVCIIEAMKLMNELEAEVKGEIVEILAENGQLVEYGQELFVVRPL
ncbi:acetyl-CoA carboxylase biotin carboxyl carrier protein [Anaerobacillus sp. MEB173]|uniref:acetyl-CoA carboxylase biotin carboxyl carrier protein n=1 Tax=Anaerobacillus sp. MEB173 TaxID=3383345 RepID=UPI003F9052CC